MGTSSTEHSFWADFRKFFGRGLAILLPSVLTLWILWQLGLFVYQNVGAPINRGIRLAVIEVLPLIVDEQVGEAMPSWWNPTDEQVHNYLESRRREGHRVPRVGEPEYEAAAREARDLLRRRGFRDWWNDHWYLEAAGLIVAIILIYLAGLILGNLLGRRLYAKLEKTLARVPGFKQIYPHVKQVVDLIMGDRAVAFKSAVLVEYPRKGMWTMGFVTGTSLPAVREQARSDCYSIFIPSTPAPFTGFTINVRREDAIELPLTIDQAIRFIITGGVLTTDDEDTPTGSVRGVDPPPLPPPREHTRDSDAPA